MKKILSIICICLFTLPVFAKNTILIVGDSISAGYGMAVNQSWPVLLQKRLQHENYDYQVVNASISGDTTSNGLSRLSKALIDNKPTITIIELGANDGLRGLAPETIKNNLAQMITLAKQSGSKVLLVGIRLPPNLGNAYTSQFQKIYLDLAQETNISVIPLMLKGIDENQNMMQADRIHPRAEAQIIILNNVWPELQKLL